MFRLRRIRELGCVVSFVGRSRSKASRELFGRLCGGILPLVVQMIVLGCKTGERKRVVGRDRVELDIDLCGRFSRLCNRLHLSSVDLIGKMLVAFSYFAQVYIVLFKPLAGQQSEALENRQAIFI